MKLGRLTAVLALVALAMADPALADPSRGHCGVTVMSRNVYHGVDAELDAVPGASGVPDLLAKVAAVYQGYHDRDFPARAAALAQEIARTKPALIGLQEAVLVRTDTPVDGSGTPATTVDLDFLAILLDALEARGLRYAPVGTIYGFDAELPGGLGFDVRHTDREVILVRRHADLEVSNPQAGTFAVNCTIPAPGLGGAITMKRGWVSVDVRSCGVDFRFVSTHLDGDCLPVTPAIQAAQARELLSGPLATSLPVVLVGDLNSAPDSVGGAYGRLAAGEFIDTWIVAGSGPGFTCCQAATSTTPSPSSRPAPTTSCSAETSGWRRSGWWVTSPSPACRRWGRRTTRGWSRPSRFPVAEARSGGAVRHSRRPSTGPAWPEHRQHTPPLGRATQATRLWSHEPTPA